MRDDKQISSHVLLSSPSRGYLECGSENRRTHVAEQEGVLGLNSLSRLSVRRVVAYVFHILAFLDPQDFMVVNIHKLVKQ